MHDRKKFYDGILYISLRGCESGHMFLTRLSLAIQSNGKFDEKQLNSLNKLLSKESSVNDERYANEEDQHKMKNFILQILREKEVLLILDN
jgi:hypothetical protein